MKSKLLIIMFCVTALIFPENSKLYDEVIEASDYIDKANLNNDTSNADLYKNYKSPEKKIQNVSKDSIKQEFSDSSAAYKDKTNLFSQKKSMYQNYDTKKFDSDSSKLLSIQAQNDLKNGIDVLKDNGITSKIADTAAKTTYLNNIDFSSDIAKNSKYIQNVSSLYTKENITTKMDSYKNPFSLKSTSDKYNTEALSDRATYDNQAKNLFSGYKSASAKYKNKTMSDLESDVNYNTRFSQERRDSIKTSFMSDSPDSLDTYLQVERSKLLKDAYSQAAKDGANGTLKFGANTYNTASTVIHNFSDGLINPGQISTEDINASSKVINDFGSSDPKYANVKSIPIATTNLDKYDKKQTNFVDGKVVNNAFIQAAKKKAGESKK